MRTSIFKILCFTPIILFSCSEIEKNKLGGLEKYYAYLNNIIVNANDTTPKVMTENWIISKVRKCNNKASLTHVFNDSMYSEDRNFKCAIDKDTLYISYTKIDFIQKGDSTSKLNTARRFCYTMQKVSVFDINEILITDNPDIPSDYLIDRHLLLFKCNNNSVIEETQSTFYDEETKEIYYINNTINDVLINRKNKLISSFEFNEEDIETRLSKAFQTYKTILAKKTVILIVRKPKLPPTRSRIIQYRYGHGLSQEVLANRLNISESTVFHYENATQANQKNIAKANAPTK